MNKKVTRVDKPANLRKQAGSALQASEERYRGLLTHLDAGVVVHAADTSIIMSNPRASALLGLSDKQMRGKLAIDPKWKFLKENRKPLPIEEYPVNQIASKRQAIKDLVLGINRPATNDVVWVSVNGFPVLDDKGEISEIVISFIDITDRKQAEETLQDKNEEYEALNEELRSSVEELQAATEELQAQNEELQQQEVALRESEAKLSTLFDSMTEMVALDELVFNEQGEAINYRIINVNNAYTKITGIKKEDAVGKLATEVYKTETPAYLEEFTRVAVTGKPCEFTTYFKTMDKHFSMSVVSPKKNHFATITTDITESKQVENALLESEERHKRMIANISDVIAIMDKDGTLKYKSPNIEKWFGWQPEDLVGTDGWLTVHPADLERIQKEFFTLLDKDNSVTTVEYRYKCKDSIYKWISLTAINLTNDPIISGVLMNYHDITERRQAEEAQARAKIVLEQTFEQSSIPMALVSMPDAVIRIINPACIEHLGMLDEPSLIGTPLMAFKSSYTDYSEQGEVVNTTELPLARALTGSITINQMGKVVRKDGTIRWHLISASPIYNTAKEIIAAYLTLIDITDLKQAEKLLIDITGRLRLATFAAKAGVWDWNIQTNEMNWDDRMLELYGLTHDNFPGGVEAWQQGLHPDDSSRAIEECQSALRGERDFDTEFRVRRPDGTVVHIKADGLVLRDEEGNPLRMIGLNTDITSRRQAEEEKQILEERLIRAEKMESLGLLAGGVAHDLNNVLGIVVGYAEILLDSVDEKSPLRKDLKTIFDGGQKAAAIVDDLLTLARRGVVGKKVLNLNKLIGDFKKSPQWEKLLTYHPSVKIQTELEDDLLNIAASSVHLEKTLYNLVSNAGEAMTKGGKINIKTSNRYIDKPIHGYDTIHEGDYVVLSVSDEGSGISETDLKRIFDPFYTKKIMGRSGTGLGLSVVWGTVKDHQGYIDIQSEEGKGTTFTLYFLITREDIEKQALAESMSDYLGNGQSLLIVDDVKDQRDLAARLLKSLNYKVLSVSSGEDAIK